MSIQELAVTVSTTGTRTFVKAPYHPEFRAAARKIGGVFAAGLWGFDARDERRVRDLCDLVYGTDGTPGPVLTVRVHLKQWWPEKELWLLGRRVAARTDRDVPVRLGPGVILVEGEFPDSGGSRATPRLGNNELALDGVYVEVRDVPHLHQDLGRENVVVVAFDKPGAVDPAGPVIHEGEGKYRHSIVGAAAGATPRLHGPDDATFWKGKLGVNAPNAYALVIEDDPDAIVLVGSIDDIAALCTRIAAQLP